MYLVVGANGYLGSYVVRSLLEQTQQEVIAAARRPESGLHAPRVHWQKCDVCVKEDVDALAQCVEACGEPVKVIYLAASHHPDVIARDPRAAWNTNVTALSYFINRLEGIKSFYYSSTEYVYGNSEGMYRFQESDSLHPAEHYGRQKVVAESLVCGYGYNAVRLPFMIGASICPTKKHFYDVIVQTLRNGEKIEMFCDSYKSALNFCTVASLLVQVMEMAGPVPQIMNICSDEALSKYDIALRIADKYNLDKNLVIPIRMEQQNRIFETARPQSTLMDNTRLKSLLGLEHIYFEA